MRGSICIARLGVAFTWTEMGGVLTRLYLPSSHPRCQQPANIHKKTLRNLGSYVSPYLGLRPGASQSRILLDWLWKIPDSFISGITGVPVQKPVIDDTQVPTVMFSRRHGSELRCANVACPTPLAQCRYPHRVWFDSIRLTHRPDHWGITPP